MSTASSSAQPTVGNRNTNECAVIVPVRDATPEEQNRQEIEVAIHDARHIDSGDPLDRAWYRCTRQSRSGENERPDGIVVVAVREWIARRGLGDAFTFEEIERCICDWCRCGRQGPRIPGTANVRAVLGGE